MEPLGTKGPLGTMRPGRGPGPGPGGRHANGSYLNWILGHLVQRFITAYCMTNRPRRNDPRLLAIHFTFPSRPVVKYIVRSTPVRDCSAGFCSTDPSDETRSLILGLGCRASALDTCPMHLLRNGLPCDIYISGR